MATVVVIGVGELTGSVNSLCFSRADSGSMIVAIDDSADKIISVWEWQRGDKGHKVTETRVSGTFAEHSALTTEHMLINEE